MNKFFGEFIIYDNKIYHLEVTAFSELITQC